MRISRVTGHRIQIPFQVAFAHAGLPIGWRGSGRSEKGIGPDGRVLIEVDPRYFRPTEVDLLQGDAGKARRELGWKPRVGFADLVRLMVDADLAAER